MEKKNTRDGVLYAKANKASYGSIKDYLRVFFFFDGVHAHTCMHTHTCKPLNSAFMATIRANASLNMLKPVLLWDTQCSFFIFFFSKALAISLTQISCCPFGRLCTLGREPYLKKKKNLL